MKESGQSQVFMAFDVRCFGDNESTERIANEVIDALHAVKGRDGKTPRYPGEQTFKLREENMRRSAYLRWWRRGGRNYWSSAR